MLPVGRTVVLIFLGYLSATWPNAQAAGAAPEHLPTEVTILYEHVGDRDELRGVVNADYDLPACVRRKVEVYRRKSGPDQLFATTKSLRTKYGYALWAIDRDRLRHGEYYARVAEKRAQVSGEAFLCEPDRTARITVPSGIGVTRGYRAFPQPVR